MRPPLLSRRQLIHGGVAAWAGAQFGTAVRADAQIVLGDAPTPARGWEAIRPALSGVGLYVGNEWYDWDSPARRFALAKIRAWGFDFVCPKVGGYGRTTYRDEAELRGWAEAAHGVGLGIIPFLYTIPDTAQADAQLAAQIAHITGIVCVDMEDEWGTHTAGPTAKYQGAAMAAFGASYRAEAGALPIIVTGYGDPLTRFGPVATGFPHAELAAWADAYSPQWYLGEFSRYHKNGVGDALAWVQGECRAALGAEFPICPSVGVGSPYFPSGLMPQSDIVQMMGAVRAGDAPVFVWEYAQIIPNYAESLLGPPTVTHVRWGRTEPTTIRVLWDTHIPARGTLTLRPPNGPSRTASAETLELTQAAAFSSLAPGTAYAASVQAHTGGGVSPAVPLTVCTPPATPGIFAQAAIAAATPSSPISVTLLLANSADQAAPNVQITALSVTGAVLVTPPTLPLSLGALGARDWQASGRDRVELTLTLSLPVVSTDSVILHLAGTSANDTPWSASLPIFSLALS
jgi:hypothetical protein